MKIKTTKRPNVLTFRQIPAGKWFRWADPQSEVHYYCKLPPTAGIHPALPLNAFELRTGRHVHVTEGQEIVVATIKTVEFKE